MVERKLKPMMHIDEMVSYLKLKNIKFEKISEKDALKYLRQNNNYYNLTSYNKILISILLMENLPISILI